MDTTEESPNESVTVEVEFEKLSDTLGLSSETKVRAWEVWQEFSSITDQSNLKDGFSDWLMLAVYTAVIDLRKSNSEDGSEVFPSLTLTHILQQTGSNVLTFTEKMRRFREDVNVSEAVRQHVMKVEKQYCISSPLYQRFNREWGTVFREEEKSSVPLQQDGTNYRKELCWTLFLNAKERLMPDSHELIHLYYMLLTCLEFVLRDTPSFQLHPPFDVMKLKQMENLDPNEFNKIILMKLSEHFLTGCEELVVMQKETEPFFQSLKTPNGDMDVVHLKHLYEETYRENGGLNELLFLQNDPHLIPDQNKSQTSVSTPRKECPVTPIRATMNSIQELNNTLSTSQETPCTQLKCYFEKCSSNPETSIIARVEKFRKVFCDRYVIKTNSSQKTIAEQRFKQAACLYYRVMKMLLDMETERLSQSDFSKLLNNDTFHRSLLACSVEIVLITYNISCYPSRCRPESEDYVFAFPWILEVFNLFAYDFYKVLESFIKVEPNLTREIVQHLTCIENKILDSIAWKSGSPVFEAIERSETVNSSFISPGGGTVNGSQSTGAELYLSPVRGQRTRGTLQENGTSPGKSNLSNGGNQSRESPQSKSINNTRRSHSLTMFFNKVCRLGYHRLITLCDLLQVPKDTQQKIWTCLEFSITSQPQLMMNRHLDQIMMCSLYGICKVSECEIKFKDIVKYYSSLPHADPKVYKQTLIKDQHYDSIINFYNIIFMQTMKNFILQFAKPVQPNLSPVPRPVSASLNNSPVYRIQGRQNFYVSPLKESPFKKCGPSPGSMTPRSRQLYNFGDSIGSSMKLRSINESLSAFKSRSNQPSVVLYSRPVGKRLSFENAEDNQQNSPINADECSTAVVVKKKRVVPPKPNTDKTSKH